LWEVDVSVWAMVQGARTVDHHVNNTSAQDDTFVTNTQTQAEKRYITLPEPALVFR